MSTELILHHYPASPFAEKVRMVLGFGQLPWKSVIIPSVMPKPDVVALTGGYRRTPILQIGADIYCDTSLICEVLEHKQPGAVLYPPHLKASPGCLPSGPTAPCSDSQWPTTCSPRAQRCCLPAAARGQGGLFGRPYGHEREHDAPAHAGCRARLPFYLRRIAHMVESDFLFGAEPCVADFAALPPAGFTRARRPWPMFDHVPRARMDGPHGRTRPWPHGKFTAQDAITVAAGAEPLPT